MPRCGAMIALVGLLVILCTTSVAKTETAAAAYAFGIVPHQRQFCLPASDRFLFVSPDAVAKVDSVPIDAVNDDSLDLLGGNWLHDVMSKIRRGQRRRQGVQILPARHDLTEPGSPHLAPSDLVIEAKYGR